VRVTDVALGMALAAPCLAVLTPHVDAIKEWRHITLQLRVYR